MLGSGVSLGAIGVYQRPNFISGGAPSPTLDLDFVSRRYTHPLTVSRASTATYFDSEGVIRTAPVNTLRIDHDPVTGECKGALIEEARTNIVLHSAGFSNWVASQTSIVANAYIAPDGTMTASKIVEDTVNSRHLITSASLTITADLKYTRSLFAKAAERRYLILETDLYDTWVNDGFVIFDLISGSVAAATVANESYGIEYVGNGWYRCWMTSTAEALATTAHFDIEMEETDSTGSLGYTGDGTSGLFIWGAQLEAGPFPTSYIPTTSAAATRVADGVSTSVGSWYNQPAGSLFVEAMVSSTNGTDSFGAIAGFSDGTEDERIFILDNPSNAMGVYIEDDVAQVNQTVSGIKDAYVRHAAGFALNDVAYIYDGVVRFSDNSATMPTPTRFELKNVNSVFGVHHIKRATYWPERLPNDILQSLTSGPPAAWTPAFLGADLALWLDAADASTITLNGSTVSQWDDKSGNGRNVSQATAANQPTYLSVGFSGKPSIRSDSNGFLEAGTTALGRNVGGLTAALVGMYPVGATFSVNTSDIFMSDGSTVNSTRFLMSPNTSASDNKYALAGRRLDGDGYATISSTTDALANRGTPWIRIGQRAYSDGVANHWTNGTQDLTAAVTQTAGNTSDTNSLRTAIFSGVATVPSNTELSEIVLTHSTMTTDDRQKLEGYLAWKWGLAANLPPDHPYRVDGSLFGFGSFRALSPSGSDLFVTSADDVFIVQ